MVTGKCGLFRSDKPKTRNTFSRSRLVAEEWRLFTQRMYAESGGAGRSRSAYIPTEVHLPEMRAVFAEDGTFATPHPRDHRG
jgi:hypothetical protein